MLPDQPFRPKRFRAWAAKRQTKDRRTGKPKVAWDVRMEIDGVQRQRRFPSAAARDEWIKRLNLGFAQGMLFDPSAREFVEAEAGTSRSLAVVVSELIELSWPAWRPRTRQTNCSIIAGFLIEVGGVEGVTRPELGRELRAGAGTPRPSVALRDLQAVDVQRWLNGMLAEGKAPMAKRSRAVIRPVFSLAVDRGYLERNPMDGVRLSLPTTDDSLDADLVLSFEEVLDLHRAALVAVPDWAPIVLLGGVCGLRPGETVVVRVCDLYLPGDGETGWITVTGTSTAGVSNLWADKAEQAQRVGPLKARAPGVTRRAPIPSSVVPLLRAAVAGKRGDEFVLPSDDLSAFRKDWKKLVSEHFGSSASVLTGLRIHDLRHAAATTWLNAGIPLKTVQRFGGWRSLVVALEVYSGVTRDDEAEGTSRLESYVSGRRDGHSTSL